MSDVLREGRVRVVRIGYNAVLDTFTGALAGWPRCISLPVISGLPADVQVIQVRDNPYTRMFEFMVSHPSFDPVREGVSYPDHDARVEWRAVELPASVTRKATIGHLDNDADVPAILGAV